MRNVIVESVAWDDSKSAGANLKSSVGARPYFECACVSLYSAYCTNPDVDRVLVTNTVVPEDCERILSGIGARVIHHPFDSFSLSRDVDWHLAYFKLCALEYVVNAGGYERVLMLDTDTWIRRPVDDLLYEVGRGGVGLLDLDHPMSEQERRTMICDAEALGLAANSCRCWGGEAICGDVEGLLALLEGCKRVQDLMEETGHFSTRGDEFLLFAAFAESDLPSVTRLNAYLSRIWTGRFFSSCRWEEKAILHLPAEKVYSFPRAFAQLQLGHELPSGWFERSCGLRPSRRPFDPRWVAKRIVDRVRK